MPRTFIIIPVRNRREITRRCLARLQAEEAPSWADVIVVDDGSTDGTGTMIREEFPWAELLAGSGELWWAGAIHLGMRHAAAKGAECVCWLNDDTLPDAHTLNLLTTTAMTRGAVCGAVCRGNDGRALAYGGGFIRDGWPKPLEEPLPAADEVPVHWLHGNAVAIPAQVWRRIGLPEWRWMRHNLADIDYTCRAHEHDIPVLLLRKATALAEINDGLSYRSWADPRSGAGEIFAGFWRPNVWWYAPGLAAFLVRRQGLRAVVSLLKFLFKAGAALALKCALPASWVARIKACKESGHVPRKVW